MADQELYTGRTRIEFLEVTLAAIAPMVAKGIKPDEVDGAAEMLHRSLHREPEPDVADAIDAWLAAVNEPRALPTSGQIWHWVTEIRRRRAGTANQTPTDLFGGVAGAGAAMPGYLRELEARLADVTRVDLPAHRHRKPAPGIDPTEGCEACVEAASRAQAIDALLADLPDFQAMARSACRGCDGSGWVLESGPDWRGHHAGAGKSFWLRCEHCNRVDDGGDS